jgi:DNA-binding HxlR family transcriptional regulator
VPEERTFSCVSNPEGTVPHPATHPEQLLAVPPGTAARERTCQVRDVLGRVGDKWSLHVIYLLAAGPKRFTELKRGIDRVSQRMLTVTLRGLERDGLVSRTVHPVVPPRVDYELTALGRTLLDPVRQLIAWTVANIDGVARARADYDARQPAANPRT